MKFVRLSMLGLLLLAGGSRALACAACFGRTDSPLAEGMNWGILSLLVFVIGLWVAFGSFFVFIARRSARTPLPGETDPVHSPDNRQA